MPADRPSPPAGRLNVVEPQVVDVHVDRVQIGRQPARRPSRGRCLRGRTHREPVLAASAPACGLVRRPRGPEASRARDVGRQPAQNPGKSPCGLSSTTSDRHAAGPPRPGPGDHHRHRNHQRGDVRPDPVPPPTSHNTPTGSDGDHPRPGQGRPAREFPTRSPPRPCGAPPPAATMNGVQVDV